MTSDTIFQELGVENSSDEFKADMLNKIMATVDLRFARVVDEIMSDEERDEFEKFSEGKNPEEISNWIAEKYEGISEMYNALIEQTVAELKSTIS